jgi:PII-like signaling protein
VNADALKLTVYFGESDRAGGRLLSDALLDVFGRAGLHVSILMRAVEGFGLKHRLRNDRSLTLSEDLPLVALAVDERARVEAVVPDVQALVGDGLVTLERARLLADGLAADVARGTAKLTVYLGRDERRAGRPAHVHVVEHLHRFGLAGATVLLGVDGTVHGRRERARFFGRNERVPLMVVSVGEAEAIASALPGLAELAAEPIATLERVQVCKREGAVLARPGVEPGDERWQKVTIYAAEQARHEGSPLHVALLHGLREAGASGATALRGVWGFSGDRPPHGDRFLRLRRDVPVVTTVVDEPEAVARWFGVVDTVTARAGLVVSELVPAYRARAEAGGLGRLELG